MLAESNQIREPLITANGKYHDLTCASSPGRNEELGLMPNQSPNKYTKRAQTFRKTNWVIVLMSATRLFCLGWATLGMVNSPVKTISIGFAVKYVNIGNNPVSHRSDLRFVFVFS